MSLTRQSTKSLTHGVEIVFGVVYKIFFLSSLVVNVILCFLFTGIMYYSHSRKQALHPAFLRCSFAFIELFLFYFEVIVLSVLKKTTKLFWLGLLLAFSRVILIIFCLTMFLYTHETYTDWLIIYAQGE
ncbi:unnamed protein product, partial [Mesorhabditis belari]|uniref:Uncharacterized protein n=1 Tax=Mesorhabditis belari TaxID=2138241 RepID=A0AAF3EAI5_9BILA